MQKDQKFKKVCFLTTVSSVRSVSTAMLFNAVPPVEDFFFPQNSRSLCWLLSRSPTTLEMRWSGWRKDASFEARLVLLLFVWGEHLIFSTYNNILVWWENLSLSSHLIFFSRVPLPLVLHPPLQNLWWRHTWWRDRWIIFHSPEDLNSLSWTWGVFIVDRKFSFPWVGAFILINHHSLAEALINRRAPLVHHQQAPHHLPPPLSLTSPSSPSSRWAWSVRPSIVEETYNLPQLIQELMTMECDL